MIRLSTCSTIFHSAPCLNDNQNMLSNTIKSLMWGYKYKIYSKNWSRHLATKAIGQEKIICPHTPTNWDNALPYTEIPGPKTFRDFRQFFPGGRLYNISLKDAHYNLRQMYGNIVRLKGFLGSRDFVIIYDPNDFEMLHRTEGPYPSRRGFEILHKYRKNHTSQIYAESVGLLVDHGPRWAALRKQVNPVMLQPKIVKQYVTGMDEIASDFCKKIVRERDENCEVSKTFGTDVTIWALESVCFVAFDTRLNAFDNLDTNSDEYRLIVESTNFFDQTYKLEIETSLWKYIKTPLYRKYIRTLDKMMEIIFKKIESATIKLNSPEYLHNCNREESVLQKLLKINRSTAIVMAVDMIIAGSDTTGALAIGLLYLLAKNPEKQEKLRHEILKILPEKSSKLTSQSLNNIPYLRACIKEALRIQAVVSGNNRAAGQDVVLQGYRVPKGTNVVTANFYTYHDENVFPEPKKFIPERWLVKDECNSKYASAKAAHPFAYLPFGFGTRTCAGKRFTELEIECLMSRLLRNFHIDWRGDGELQYQRHVFNFPTGNMPFVFTNLEH